MTSVLASTGVCPPGPPAPGWLAFEDGRIVEVGRHAAPGDADDWGDAILAPAYLDLQVNGVADVDFATADAVGWGRAARTLAAHGVGGYLATLVSAPLDRYDAALGHLETVMTGADAGVAAALGAHLEGPFLGDAPGAHPPELLGAVDPVWLDTLLDAHPGVVRMVTLAPEADPGGHGIAGLADRGVLVALGHSRVSDADARVAADAGARMVTHVFNGMGPLHHREPGLAGAALDDERLTPSVIADLVHVHPTVVRLVFAASQAVALVSDSVAVGGDVRAVDGAARLADGRLAGATVLLDDAVANVVGLGVPVERVVAAASTVPAALLGLPDRGRLVSGARADVVALELGTARLLAVWVGGERVA